MSLKLNRAEWAVLLQMLFLADWVLHGQTSERTDATKPHRELLNNVHRQAAENGLTEFVRPAKSAPGVYVTTEQFEEETKVLDFIDAYDVKSFWRMLARTLAVRDVDEELSSNAAANGANGGHIDLIEQRAQYYEEQLARNGLDKLRWVGEDAPDLEEGS